MELIKFVLLVLVVGLVFTAAFAVDQNAEEVEQDVSFDGPVQVATGDGYAVEIAIGGVA